MKLQYPSEPSLVKELHTKLSSLRKAWEDIPSLILPEIPSEERLAEILSTLFYVSLSKEEERPCKISIVYLAKDKSYPDLDVIQFVAPSPFALENIRKISLAFDEQKTFLCIEEHEGILQIWGISRTQPPHCAVFRNTPAPELLIDFGNERVFRFYRGHTTFFQENWRVISLRLSHLVNSYLPKELQDHPSTKFPKARSICSIANVMLEHKHGGCLLVVPERKAVNRDILHIRATHSLNESSGSFLREKLASFLTFDNERYEKPIKANEVWGEENRRKQLSRDWHESIEFIGRLTAVDGAVVLTSDLSLVGFGAIIKPDAHDLEHTKLYLYNSILNPHERQELNISHAGGTRHKTAIAFVKKQESAFAFVSSQDGMLSFVCKDPNEEGVSLLTNLDFVLRDIK
jgi:hypothetical protein